MDVSFFASNEVLDTKGVRICACDHVRADQLVIMHFIYARTQDEIADVEIDCLFTTAAAMIEQFLLQLAILDWAVHCLDTFSELLEEFVDLRGVFGNVLERAIAWKIEIPQRSQTFKSGE